MRATDVMIIILFIFFAGCVAALVVFWYYGHLDYETSAAPKVLEKIGIFIKENPFIMYGAVVLIAVILAVVIFLRAVRRFKRKTINERVIDEMEYKINYPR